MKILVLIMSMVLLSACVPARAQVGGGSHGARGSVSGTLIRF